MILILVSAEAVGVFSGATPIPQAEVVVLEMLQTGQVMATTMVRVREADTSSSRYHIIITATSIHAVIVYEFVCRNTYYASLLSMKAFGWRDARSDQQTVVYGAPGSAGAYPYNQRFQPRSMDAPPAPYGVAANPNIRTHQGYPPQARAPMNPYNVYNNPVAMQSYGQYPLQSGMHDAGVPPIGPMYESMPSQGMMPNQYYDPYNRPYPQSGVHSMAAGGMGQWQVSHSTSGSPTTQMNPMAVNYGSMSSSSSSSDGTPGNTSVSMSPSGKGQSESPMGFRPSGHRGGAGAPDSNRSALYGPPMPMNYPHQPRMMPGPDMSSMGMPIPPAVYQPQGAYYPPSPAAASTPMSTQMHMNMDYNIAHSNVYSQQGGRGGNRNHGARYDQGRRFSNAQDDHREWK